MDSTLKSCFIQNCISITALITEICKEDVVKTAAWPDLLDKAIQLCQSLPDIVPDKKNFTIYLTEVCRLENYCFQS